MKGIKLGTKILLSVLGVILGMTMATYLVGSRFIREVIQDEIIQSTHRARTTYDSLIKVRENRLEQVNSVISEAPQVKAALGSDLETVAQSLTEVVDKTDLDICLWWTAPSHEHAGDEPRPGQLGGFLEMHGPAERRAHIARTEAPAGNGLFDFGAGAPAPEPSRGPRRATAWGEALSAWWIEDLDPASLEDAVLGFLGSEDRRLQGVVATLNKNLRGGAAKVPMGELDTARSVIAPFGERLYIFSYKALYSRAGRALRYYGLVVGGVQIDNRLAQELHDATQLDLTFLLLTPDGKSRVIGSSRPARGSDASHQLDEIHAGFLASGELTHDSTARSLIAGDSEILVQAVSLSVSAARSDGTRGGADSSVPRGVAVMSGNLTERVSYILDPVKDALLMVSFFVAIVATIFLSTGMKFWVTDPVASLVLGMKRIQDGDFSKEIHLRNRDEMGTLAAAFNQMLVDLRKKEQYMRMVSRSAVQEIESKVTANLSEDGDRRIVTVLFSDLRDFTTLSERIDPSKLIKLLNRYFDAMVEIIYRHNGFLDKFIGDAIMAIFEEGDHARRAIMAALEMQRECQRLDREEGLGLKMGVGMHTGDVVCGFVGAKQFMNHTYLGDTVNMAARLESESKHGRHTQIIISEQTFQQVAGLVETAPLEKTHVKGKTVEVRMHEIVRVLIEDEVARSLEDPDPVRRLRYTQAAGHLGDPAVVGRLAEMAAGEDLPVALAALHAAGQILTTRRDRAPEFTGGFLAQLRTETRRDVRSALITLLGRIGHHAVITELEPYLKDPDPRVRANTVESLTQLSSRSVQTLIRPLLDDSNNRVKANASICLFEDTPEDVSDFLIDQIRRGEVLDRASAAYAIHVVVSRFPIGLLDPTRAQNLDQKGYRIHRSLQRFAGALSMACASETDPRVLRHIGDGLSVLVGSDTARSILSESARQKPLAGVDPAPGVAVGQGS